MRTEAEDLRCDVLILGGGPAGTATALSLRQTDYKIVPFSFAAGTVTVANRVTLAFDIVAYRDQGAPAPR